MNAKYVFFVAIMALFYMSGTTLVFAFLTDSGVHAPPSGGSYPFSPPGNWTPDGLGLPFPDVNETYVDPIFGTTIKRLTNNVGVTTQDNYAKNGFWNADGTHTVLIGNETRVMRVSDSTIIRASISGNFDSSFAPDDPNIWYYFSGSNLNAYNIITDSTNLVKTFPGPLSGLGGSVDWIDKTGRYMVLQISGVYRVWDKQTDTLFSGSISEDPGEGWVGISPDASYVILAGDGENNKSFAINKISESVDTTGVLFWTLCGDHADILTASDGKTYVVIFNCFDAPEVYRVDVTIPQTAGDTDKQKSDNLKLFDTEWTDEGHFSCVSFDSARDWCFISLEAGSGLSGWTAYKDEIVAANVITGEVRRYLHHRSRDMSSSGCYFCQPRIQATWDGSKILWASNYGESATDYGDIYMSEIAFSSSSIPAFPGLPTSPSDSAASTPAFPGLPTSPSDSAASTPAFPGLPTSPSDSAASTPAFPGAPTLP